MLSPRYLDGIADELTELYSQLETDILQRVAKRLKKLGTPTDASEWQTKILAESGGIKGDVAKILKGYSKPIQKQVTSLVTDAINKSVSNDNRIFEKMTGRTVSSPNAQTMLSIIQQTYSDLSRITQTTAFNTEKEFIKQANRAFMNTSSGAFSYSDAMKMACDDLADKGVYTVYYNNGVPVTKSIETAVRMNILTSVNHTAANISLNNCEELDCDLVEVSAHIGARPEHAEWQGQIFSRSGTSKKYKSFDICRLGEIDGLCGINCRHSFYPYFEGMEKVYSDEELKEMNDPARYEQEQKQRYIEKQVRHYKRRAVIEEAGGVDNTKSRVKLGEWQAKAKEHAEKYNLKRDYNREWIGTKDGVQPKGLPPAIQSREENRKLANTIKRLDNARIKEIAKVPQGKPMNFQQADGGACNPNFNKGGGYRKNCQTCVPVYEARRRGFDVEALNNYQGSMSEILSYDTALVWVDRTTGKKPTYIYVGTNRSVKTLENIKNTILENHRYSLEWTWSGKAEGHIVTINKNNKGILSLYDPQNGINYRGDEKIKEYLKGWSPSSAKLLDIESYDINMNVLNKIVQERKK